MIFLKIALLSALGVILILLHEHYHDIPTNGYSSVGYAIEAPPLAITIIFCVLFVLISGCYFILNKVISLFKRKD
jgi:hypothetical protein